LARTSTATWKPFSQHPVRTGVDPAQQIVEWGRTLVLSEPAAKPFIGHQQVGSGARELGHLDRNVRLRSTQPFLPAGRLTFGEGADFEDSVGVFFFIAAFCAFGAAVFVLASTFS
jgi:hypothetical protein